MSGALDVVVVTFANRDEVDGLLAAAGELEGLGSVVVVDNGTDGSGDRAEALGAVVLRRPDNPGFGTAQNLGVAATTAPIVLLLNPDARPDPEGIAAGARFLAEHPDVAAVQGAVVGASTGAPERSHGVELGPVHLAGRAVGLRGLLGLGVVRAVASRTALADHVQRAVPGPTDVAALAATAVLVRRDAFDSVGGFDEGYFLYGEDLDLCRRWRQAGWRLVALPERFATHRSGGSSAGWWSRELEWWRGTLRFAALWWPDRRWRAGLLAAALRWVGLAARRPRSAGMAWRALVRDPRRMRRAGLVGGVVRPARLPAR